MTIARTRTPDIDDYARRYQRGDARAFDRLCELCAPRILAVLGKLVHNPEDAQDILVEVLVTLHAAILRFKWESAFSTFMIGVTLNKYRNYVRDQKLTSRPANFSELLDDDGADDLEASLPIAGADGAAIFVTHEQQVALREMLAELPLDFRLVLVLADLHGYAYEEIARMVETPTGTVKSRLNRARKLMQEKIRARRELFDR